MKHLLLPLFVLISLSLHSQNFSCLKLKAGNVWEVEHHTGKGKADGKTTYKVAKIDSLNGNHIAMVTALTFDTKGKQQKKVYLNQECHGDTLLIDMKNYFWLRDNVSYKWRSDPAFIVYPFALEIGQKLPAATIVYTAIKAPRIATQVGPTASKNDQTGSTTTFTIENRIVEAKEDVTTPAGTFTCYRIKSLRVLDSALDYSKVEQEQIEWYAPGIGVVKTEGYKKGKLVSASQLKKKV